MCRTVNVTFDRYSSYSISSNFEGNSFKICKRENAYHKYYADRQTNEWTQLDRFTISRHFISLQFYNRTNVLSSLRISCQKASLSKTVFYNYMRNDFSLSLTSFDSLLASYLLNGRLDGAKQGFVFLRYVLLKAQKHFGKTFVKSLKSQKLTGKTLRSVVQNRDLLYAKRFQGTHFL